MSNFGIFFLVFCWSCHFLQVAATGGPAFLSLGKSFIWRVTNDKFILQTETNNPNFACGFNGSGTSYSFSIFISAGPSTERKEVWTANRNEPLDNSSMLRLAQDGNLQLVHGDGSVVWSTGTSGKPVTALQLNETGNLVLLDSENKTLWQSFDHPTDTLVATQTLQNGQRLTSSVHVSSTSTEPSYFVSMEDSDLRAFIDAKPPQMYLQLKDFNKTDLYFMNDSIGNGTISYTALRRHNHTFLITAQSIRYYYKSPNHFMKLEFDGRLNIYDWNAGGSEWVPEELANEHSDQCLYPLVCGTLGVCKNGQCSCPLPPGDKTEYFKPSDAQLPNLGCEEVTPVSCNEPTPSSLVYFRNYSYFAYVDSSAAVGNIINVNACLEACSNNCSCKAVFYNSQNENSSGNCYLLEQVFSIRVDTLPERTYISKAFFKVPKTFQPQAPPESQGGGEQGKKYKIARSIIGIAVALLAVAVFLAGTIMFLLRRRREEEEDEEEDELEQVPGMAPRRFSYEELKMATEDFQTILGQGGFGSVFMGILNDGTRIAVKRLDNVGQGMKEFVAEVQTIGSIHHWNLVRLVGFCARKLHRLLVYEYMSNGSLDRWIFHENDNPKLDWKTRQNVIIGTSKGLCYLHEECSQRIAHFDIKPQNILLDENYNAKISDFGLSKLISRDESQVVTTMRGTPGYLAPEWLSASISEKADVYSFGVVVMEVVCGRRNLDFSQPEGSRYLLKQLQSLAPENQLLDLVDMTDEERACYGEEAVRVMRIAMWCLQNDDTRRPRMSSVVKALEGTMELDGDIELGLFHATVPQLVSQTESESQSLLVSAPR
uniref:Receptor-like serine/threonine-protein kinase n=2 Tax=Nymphaea colorata TaxID=210225 RepID=A0A5K0Y0F0_9MAGN